MILSSRELNRQAVTARGYGCCLSPGHPHDKSEYARNQHNHPSNWSLRSLMLFDWDFAAMLLSNTVNSGPRNTRSNRSGSTGRTADRAGGISVARAESG